MVDDPHKTIPRIAFHEITVQFGATRALDSLSFSIAPGEIVGLLGHNGAGKSTLLNVATGAIRATSGSIAIDGTTVATASTPAQIASLGMTVVHQTPALVGNLSILDNLYLGTASTGRTAARRAEARAALSRVGGGALPLDTRVDTLSLGTRQIVDLARGALAGDMRVLLLDEPTAALGQAEADALHRLIRDLAGEGVSVVYVSHRLPDIIQVCDRAVVLREGRLVADHKIAGLTPSILARALAPDLLESEYEASDPGAVVLEIDTPHRMRFRAGEVVGLFGVASGEQFTLLRSIAGVGGPLGARLDGKVYRARGPLDAMRHEVHYVTADRDVDGLVPGLSAFDNVFLPWRGRSRAGTAIAPRADERRKIYAAARSALGIQGPDSSSPVESFSGGNRQKHLLAAWLYPARPKVLLLAQPTQGVDVGAKADIRRVVRAAARDGACVLVASAEGDEIAGLCDRSYVVTSNSMAEVSRTEHFDEDLLSALLDLIPTTESAAT